MIKDVESKSQEKMQKTLDAFVNDLSTLKAGRANPHMLDKISVDYYGALRLFLRSQQFLLRNRAFCLSSRGMHPC